MDGLRLKLQQFTTRGPSMRLFIDTEFTSVVHPKPGLLSLGAATDDGRELYVEWTQWARPLPPLTLAAERSTWPNSGIGAFEPRSRSALMLSGPS